MGVATPHALGRNLAFFTKAEATLGTAVAPTATDAVKMLKTSFSYKQARKDRQDSRATRSRLERITGKKEVTWSCEGYVLPSGALGTKPNVAPLMKALLGVETINGGASVVYTPADLQSSLGSLTMVRQLSDVFMERIVGAIVESMTLKASGGGEPTIAFQGQAVDYLATGCSTLAAQCTAGATTCQIQAGDVSNFKDGSVISIGTSTGHTVTSGGGTANLTFTPAVVGTQAISAVVAPYVPAPTTAGNPVNGIQGSLTVDAASLPITALELTVKNNLKVISDEAFVAGMSDYIPGWREVSGKLSVRVRRDHVVYLTKRDDFATRAILFTLGSGNGKRLTVSVPYAEVDFSEVQVPDDGTEATCEIPFNALGSSGADEVAFTWQ